MLPMPRRRVPVSRWSARPAFRSARGTSRSYRWPPRPRCRLRARRGAGDRSADTGRAADAGSAAHAGGRTACGTGGGTTCPWAAAGRGRCPPGATGCPTGARDRHPARAALRAARAGGRTTRAGRFTTGAPWSSFRPRRSRRAARAGRPRAPVGQPLARGRPRSRAHGWRARAPRRRDRCVRRSPAPAAAHRGGRQRYDLGARQTRPPEPDHDGWAGCIGPRRCRQRIPTGNADAVRTR